MTLRDRSDLKNTQAKLARLEARYDALRKQTSEDEELREATLTSLKRYINQFKEEITRYEAHHVGQE